MNPTKLTAEKAVMMVKLGQPLDLTEFIKYADLSKYFKTKVMDKIGVFQRSGKDTSLFATIIDEEVNFTHSDDEYSNGTLLYVDFVAEATQGENDASVLRS
jgi:hypothetical protein